MGKIALVVIGALVLIGLLLGGWVFGSYNTMVEKRNLADKQWAQVENNLQRRADLIPNLVNSVKGFANLEQGILTRIADSRSRILSATATPASAATPSPGAVCGTTAPIRSPSWII